jgi:hypothetical protein
MERIARRYKLEAFEKESRIVTRIVSLILLLVLSPTLSANEIDAEQAENEKTHGFSSQKENINKPIILLETRLEHQAQKIQKLEAELRSVNSRRDDGMSFEVWAGLLLASSALLLTIIGIGIALLSVFGYRKLAKSSKEAAEKVSIKVARETSEATANKATAAELVRLLEAGKFDNVIREAIETISFRGVTGLDELEEGEQSSEG